MTYSLGEVIRDTRKIYIDETNSPEIVCRILPLADKNIREILETAISRLKNEYLKLPNHFDYMLDGLTDKSEVIQNVARWRTTIPYKGGEVLDCSAKIYIENPRIMARFMPNTTQHFMFGDIELFQPYRQHRCISTILPGTKTIEIGELSEALIPLSVLGGFPIDLIYGFPSEIHQILADMMSKLERDHGW